MKSESETLELVSDTEALYVRSKQGLSFLTLANHKIMDGRFTVTMTRELGSFLAGFADTNLKKDICESHLLGSLRLVSHRVSGHLFETSTKLVSHRRTRSPVKLPGWFPVEK